MIISVGYRVKSQRGTQFRKWATQVLRDHLVKGYTVYEQRLKEEKTNFVKCSGPASFVLEYDNVLFEGGAGDSQEAEFKKLLKIENWEVPIVEVTYSDAIF